MAKWHGQDVLLGVLAALDDRPLPKESLQTYLDAVAKVIRNGDVNAAAQFLAAAAEMVDEIGGPLPLADQDPAVASAYLRLVADCDMAITLQKHGVSVEFQRLVGSIGPDDFPEKWRQIRRSIEDVAKEHRCDEDHLLTYTRAIVALACVDDGSRRIDMPRPDLVKADVDAFQDALTEFYRVHINPSATVAEGFIGGLIANDEIDVKRRILSAVQWHRTHPGEPMPPDDFAAVMADIDAFNAKVSRHEYSRADARDVVAVITDLRDSAIKSRADVESRRDELYARMERLKRIIRIYESGPAHMIALEQQWRAYRINAAAYAAVGHRQTGALHLATIEALRTSTAYCWAPMPVEAVASAAKSLQPDMALSPTALADLGLPSACGWWWFEEPIPIETTAKGAIEEPVVALLWRREIDVERGSRIWMSAFVIDDAKQPTDGPQIGPFATPTLAWIWHDGVSIERLERRLRFRFDGLEAAHRDGFEATDVDRSTQAALWFSRFFLAAATWLRQRIVVSERGANVRQVARRIQREQKLKDAPTVAIVHLRRRASVRREAPADAEKRSITYTCRWVVEGHMRNQWYSSTGTHAPKWIESYDKGPEGLPLRTKTKIYAVER